MKNMNGSEITPVDLSDITNLFTEPVRGGKVFVFNLLRKERYWNGVMTHTDINVEKLQIQVKMTRNRVNDVIVTPISGGNSERAAEVEKGLKEILSR